MILGFVLGWCAATYWWPWVLSFYEQPKTRLYAKDGELFALLKGKTERNLTTDADGNRLRSNTQFGEGEGVIGVRQPRWPKDGGP